MHESSVVSPSALALERMRALLASGDCLYYIETHRLKSNYLTVTQWWAVNVETRRLVPITRDVAEMVGASLDPKLGSGLKLCVNDHPAQIIVWQLGKALFSDPHALRYSPMPGHPDRMPLRDVKRKQDAS